MTSSASLISSVPNPLQAAASLGLFLLDILVYFSLLLLLVDGMVRVLKELNSCIFAYLHPAVFISPTTRLWVYEQFRKAKDSISASARSIKSFIAFLAKSVSVRTSRATNNDSTRLNSERASVQSNGADADVLSTTSKQLRYIMQGLKVVNTAVVGRAINWNL
jgi:hypothetical protein